MPKSPFSLRREGPQTSGEVARIQQARDKQRKRAAEIARGPGAKPGEGPLATIASTKEKSGLHPKPANDREPQSETRRRTTINEAIELKYRILDLEGQERRLDPEEAKDRYHEDLALIEALIKAMIRDPDDRSIAEKVQEMEERYHFYKNPKTQKPK